jgi:hypothetical protein
MNVIGKFMNPTEVNGWIHSASDIYAISQGKHNTGALECHWCASKSDRTWMHDGDPVRMHVKKDPTILRMANLYICSGCWHWRRKRITITFLDGTIKDSQCPMNHSWLITEKKARAIQKKDYSLLKSIILDPPLKFVLTLLADSITSGKLNAPTSIENRIQCAKLNDNSAIKADTLIYFTLNNTPHTYTVYEMEQAIKYGSDGKLPGVRALTNLLGIPETGEEPKTKKVGRPSETDKANNEKMFHRIVKES